MTKISTRKNIVLIEIPEDKLVEICEKLISLGESKEVNELLLYVKDVDSVLEISLENK